MTQMSDPKIMTIDIPEDVTHVEIDGVRFKRDWFRMFAEGKKSAGYVMFVKPDPDAKGLLIAEINKEMADIFEAHRYLARKMKTLIEIATDEYRKDDPECK
jgi:hypothetical protein